MKGKVSCEDVFTITGRGTVISGQLKEGDVEVGDFIKFGDYYSKITGIESFRRNVKRVWSPDENIGILVSGISKDDAKKYITKITGELLEISNKSFIREKKLNELGI